MGAALSEIRAQLKASVVLPNSMSGPNSLPTQQFPYAGQPMAPPQLPPATYPYNPYQTQAGPYPPQPYGAQTGPP